MRPATHQAKKLFEPCLALVATFLLPAKSEFVNIFECGFLKCNGSSDKPTHFSLSSVRRLSRSRTHHIPRTLCIANLFLLAFCGAFHSRQVLPVFCQKVSLKSLAYANPDVPRLGTESVHNKKDFSKYVLPRRGQAAYRFVRQPSREKTFCAEYQ